MSGLFDHLIDRLAAREVAVRPRKPEPFAADLSGDAELDELAIEPVAATVPPRITTAPDMTWDSTDRPDQVTENGLSPEQDLPKQQRKTDALDIAPGRPKPSDATPQDGASQPVSSRDPTDEPPAEATKAADPNAQADPSMRETKLVRETQRERVELIRREETRVTEATEVTKVLSEAVADVSEGSTGQAVEQNTPGQAPQPNTPIQTQAPAPPVVAQPTPPTELIGQADKTDFDDPEIDVPTQIQIEIGRVEIHAPTSTSPSPKPARSTRRKPASVMSLDSYLASKGGGS